MPGTLYTIGHSTRHLEELEHMLNSNGIKMLVDVRTVPKSRTNPQFNKEALEQQLPEHGIQYLWLGKELGGLRKRDKSSEANAGWDNASFRGYADYMQTDAFQEGLQQLLELAEGANSPVAIMCAEVVSFRCHRSLISDAASVRGWKVLHITAPDRDPTPHKLTKFAAVEGEREGVRITYPAYEHTPKQKKKSSSEVKEVPKSRRKGSSVSKTGAIKAYLEPKSKAATTKKSSSTAGSSEGGNSSKGGTRGSTGSGRGTKRTEPG